MIPAENQDYQPAIAFAAKTVDWATTIIALTLIVLLAGTIGHLVDARRSVLFLIGGALGLTLYHASFGFSGGWRLFILERRGAPLRAQLLTIGFAAVVFIPLLAFGEAFGRPLGGAVAPVGLSVVLGAGLFGLGMQLGGSCGSGTLFTVGGGNLRMVVTLLFFIAGAVVGTAHLPWWLDRPTLPAMSLTDSIGAGGATAATVLLLAGIAALTSALELRRHGRLAQPIAPAHRGVTRLIRGPWSLLHGAIALATLNLLVLLVAGHPWSITYAFALWGAKAIQSVGIPVETWTFWTWPTQARNLAASLLAETTSVMNFGIILGAALAAGLAGSFGHNRRVPLRSLLAAAIGGLLMGYGARLAFGCNIGAMFSGIASGSLHGWLWFAAAFGGSYIGIRLRPWFGQ